MSSSEQFFIMAVTFNPSDSQTGFGVSLPDFWSFYRLLADWKKGITAAVDVLSCGPGGLKVNRLAAGWPSIGGRRRRLLLSTVSDVLSHIGSPGADGKWVSDGIRLSNVPLPHFIKTYSQKNNNYRIFLL